MDERPLLDALVDRFVEECRSATERLAERRAAEAALSDEAWWNRTVARWPEGMPSGADFLQARKEEMIRGRRDQDLKAQSVDLAAIAKRKAEETLPFLLDVRQSEATDGPLTDAQFYEATRRASQASIRGTLDRLQKASERATDPRRQHILAALAETAAIDREELASLQGPDLTEERLQRVADGIVARLKAFTKIVQSPE